jgi:teichuronic acid biosynthesis glycosyltransferase TuaG
MKEELLISVIIPLYNAEKFIAETIETVLKQTYQNFEILIVDDCSTDGSVSIVNHMAEDDDRIKLIQSDTNFGGPAKPRNIGVEHAKGEYIAFLDADDLWDEKKLELQLGMMMENDIHFSSTGKINIDESSQKANLKAGVLAKVSAKNSKKDLCDLIKYRFVFTSSVMVLKSIMPLFNEEKKYIAVEDLCAWMEIFKSDGKYQYMQEPLLKYRIVNQSISARGTEYKHATKAYICMLHFILKYELYENMACFYKACARDYSLNFLQKIFRK